jgi:hypothetical protein
MAFIFMLIMTHAGYIENRSHARNLMWGLGSIHDSSTFRFRIYTEDKFEDEEDTNKFIRNRQTIFPKSNAIRCLNTWKNKFKQ